MINVDRIVKSINLSLAEYWTGEYNENYIKPLLKKSVINLRFKNDLPKEYLYLMEEYDIRSVKLPSVVDCIKFFTVDKLESAYTRYNKKKSFPSSNCYPFAKETFGESVYFFESLGNKNSVKVVHLELYDFPVYQHVSDSFFQFLQLLDLWVRSTNDEEIFNNFQSKFTKEGKLKYLKKVNEIDPTANKEYFWNGGSAYDTKKSIWQSNN